MIDSSGDLMLTEADFPPEFKDFAHPDDYKLQTEPIEPECIFHSYPGGHNRLIYRVSFYVGPEQYFTLSFVCDTGAPKHLYLSTRAITMLRKFNLLKVDAETDIPWISVSNKKVPVDETPQNHAPANILGLKFLCKLGLQLSEDSFKFISAPAFL